jgi:hypothetical protein
MKTRTLICNNYVRNSFINHPELHKLANESVSVCLPFAVHTVSTAVAAPGCDYRTRDRFISPNTLSLLAFPYKCYNYIPSDVVHGSPCSTLSRDVFVPLIPVL